MFTYQNGIVRTSVRQLVEYLLREGDIHSQGSLLANVETMQAGSRIHRKIQKEQKVTYRAEVPLKMEWQQEGYRMVLEGRADGIDHTSPLSFMEDGQISIDDYLKGHKQKDISSKKKIYYVDEIKGVFQNVMTFENARAMHLAQAKCYAAMFLRQKDLDVIGVQITYCNIETEEIKRFHYQYDKEELEEWFQELIDSYKMWADAYVKAYDLRQESIKKLVFPFDYRAGQKKLIAMVYHSIFQKNKVFFQAPTGIGKTIATIYPALQALAQNKGEKIFYLTAKTITRTVAEDTIYLLRKQKLSIKAVTLTAKEKICVNDICECNPEICSRAKGHFDRINGAVYDLFTQEDAMTRELILQYSEKHQVCPYELAFELASFADFIICDYNYVFDPHVNKNSLYSENQKNILLIDEAHNLVERARTMYSADLSEEDLKRMKKILPPAEKQLLKKARNCQAKFKKIKESCQTEKLSDYDQASYVELNDVDALYFPMIHFLDALLEYLTDHPVFENREEIVDLFFDMRHFTGIMESMTEGYRIYGVWIGKEFIVRLFCIDPSSQLRDILDTNSSAIFFSATLLPMPYYRKLLYGDGASAFAIASPFDSGKRLVCIADDVTSRYTRRNKQEYRKILSYLEENLRARKGNYMIFFPSYEMMTKTRELLDEEMEKHSIFQDAEIMVQDTMMDEREKEKFLEYFSEDRDNSLVGFCVLGSIFSEGIDLAGRRLIGVLIVGTGLPKVCVERDMIRDYFDADKKKGYDYAYRYPGMNKVLQAAGRVIRTADDVGVITLLDERFLWRENQYLLPDDWDRYYKVNLTNYGAVLSGFWKEGKKEQKKDEI